MNDTLIVEATKDTIDKIGTALAHTLALAGYEKFKNDGDFVGKFNVYSVNNEKYFVYFETNGKVVVMTEAEAEATKAEWLY